MRNKVSRDSFSSGMQGFKSFSIILIIIVFCFAGCKVEEFPGSAGEPEGSLAIAVSDTLDESVEGAAIIIDGVETPERSPAIIHGISEGEHQLVIRQFGFWNDTTQVGITGGDTTSVVATLHVVPPNMTGQLTVESSPAGAFLLLNGRKHFVNDSPALTPGTFDLPWGRYNLSVHLPGYLTTYPILPEIEIFPGESQSLEFTLNSSEIGRSAGNSPYPFTLENISGDSISVSDLTGYVVLINFWYAACAPCIAEFPGIENVYRKYSMDGFRVLAINPMRPDNREAVIQKQDELDMTFQLLLDWDQHVTRDLYVVGEFPQNFLIDRTGKLHDVRGGVEESELDEMVSELLQTENGQ
ncbi:MAG: redoxin domain-containing protein [Bacteroidetes bacterium]|jgi:peroxiredoxin|nr:redoxin domain-containing protein [Bacteroidota bacterium]